LPRAALKGARDAAQESAQFLVDAGNWLGSKQDALVGVFGGAPGRDLTAPKLPEIDAPKSTTGKLAASVSQFITGMVGLGKLSKGIEVTGRAAKLATESAKAATVGAVAFDPSSERLSNLIESVPVLSNPVTAYLKSDPKDSAAEGRVKNALESIGMDAVLVGGIMASTRLYKVLAEQRAGRATQADVDRAVAEAETQQAGANAPRGEPKAAPVVEAPSLGPVELPATVGVPDTPAPKPARDVLELSAGPQATPKRDVLDLGGPQAEPGEVAPVASIVAQTSPPPRIEVTPEQTTGLLKSMREDAEALAKADGDWSRAVAEGHTFGRGERVPWQKIATVGPDGDGLTAFMARLSDEVRGPLNAARGGDANGVLSDASVQAMVRDSARLFGDDPVMVTGRLAMAGDAARSLAVDLEVSYVASNRALQDAYALAARIKAGDLTEFAGNAEAATEALRQTLQTASTFYGYGQAIRAGAGRTLRRMREEFGPKAEDIEAMRGLSPEALVDAVAATGGDLRAVHKLTQRSVLARLGDALEFSFVNGLLWGPRSHFVNFMTNAYMVGARPLERMIGGGLIGVSRAGWNLMAGTPHGITEGLATAQAAFQRGVQEYAYIGTSLSNAWKMAAETWRRGDSMLSPHSLENLTASRINPAQLRFKAPENLPAVLHNAVTALAKITGFPTRALGTVDELVQQTVYRSHVQAKAHAEGAQAGLIGDELTAHVRGRLEAAFDADLRATDAASLQEARTSTFQQDLLPGTVGRSVASFTAQHQWSRFIVPFVRTPTNVLRYGWKLTPALNLAQREYREMLSGRMGAEAQAQAVGQMTMGTLFFGYAGFLAHSGSITGAGPSDAKLKAGLMATGWRPYSVVKVWADGSRTYIPFSPFDPVGLPFGIAADIVDAISNAYDGAELPHYVTEAMLGAGMSVAKQMANKAYLKSLDDFLEAITSPERGAEKWAGATASGLIPFSSALRFANPDPLMRDARSVTDRMLATIPGLSATLPPKRDVWGDPVTVHKGLWVSSDADLVDAEMRRMILEAGLSVGPPNPVANGVDLREVTMVDGSNAYDRLQTYAAKPSKNGRSLKEKVAWIMNSPGYQRAPDGDAATRGTKLAMLTGTIAKHRAAAMQRLRADANVRRALYEKQRDVAAAYAAKKAPQTPQQQGRATIGAIGEAFGVDLDGLMQQ
jgi:hypothetical protein